MIEFEHSRDLNVILIFVPYYKCDVPNPGCPLTVR